MRAELWGARQEDLLGTHRGRFEEAQDRFRFQQEADRRVEEAFAGRLADPDPVFRGPDDLDAIRLRIAEERARAEVTPEMVEQVRREWLEEVKSRFDERWQESYGEYRRGEISRSEFAETFDRLSAGLHEEFELSAAAHLARRTANEVFDAETGSRRQPMSQEELRQVRQDFADAAVGEVYRAAEGMRTADGERDGSFDWSHLYRAYDSGLKDLTRGLRTRLELAAEAADTFDFLSRRVGADAEAPWVREVRGDFRGEFEVTTRTLPGGDGTPTRWMEYEAFRKQRPVLNGRLAGFRDRWEARLNARVTEEGLKADVAREVEARRVAWQRSSRHDPADAAAVDMEAVVTSHREELTAEGERFLAGRDPRALTRAQWEAYAAHMRDAQERLAGEVPVRLEYQVGLDRALAEADRMFDALEADGPGTVRAREGLREDVTRVYRALAGRAEDGSWDVERVAAGQDFLFREYLPNAERSLPGRLEFEWGMEGALRDGGLAFHRLSGPGLDELTERPARHYTVSDEAFDRLADDFRGDWAEGYHEIYGPSERDLRGWLEREKERGDTFGSTVRGEWEADVAELRAPRDAAVRARAEAESARWRQQVAANFQGMLGKGAVLEELARQAEIPQAGIRSARVSGDYQRGLSDLRSWFSREWDAAARTSSPAGEAGVRAALVEHARRRWQELGERTRAEDEAARAWQREPRWTLDLGRMEITRERRAPSEETATTVAGDGGQLQSRELLAAREERQAPPPLPAAAPPRTAVTRTDTPPAQEVSRTRTDAVPVPVSEALAELRDTVATRDRAYQEFESRLAPFSELRAPQATDRVAAAREAFADAWAGDRTATGPAEFTPARSAALEDLTARLTSVTERLAAEADAAEVFHRDIVSTVSDLRHGEAFARSQSAVALEREFVEEAAGRSSAGVADLVQEFGQRYTEAQAAWVAGQQHRAAFDAVLGGAGGRADLTDGRAEWNGQTRRWYTSRLARLRQQYVADRAEVLAVADEAGRRERLERLDAEVRQAALYEQRWARTAVAYNRVLADHTARFGADAAWDRELAGWYEERRRALAAPLTDRLHLFSPQAREQALARLDAQTAALREVAEARHTAFQDFARQLDAGTRDTVTLSHAATVDFTRRRIAALRDAYLETVQPAEFPAAHPQAAAEDDWRIPAWQEAQRELHRNYADLLAQDRTEDTSTDADGGEAAESAGAAIDEAFRQWVREAHELTAVTLMNMTADGALGAGKLDGAFDTAGVGLDVFDFSWLGTATGDVQDPPESGLGPTGMVLDGPDLGTTDLGTTNWSAWLDDLGVPPADMELDGTMFGLPDPIYGWPGQTEFHPDESMVWPAEPEAAPQTAPDARTHLWTGPDAAAPPVTVPDASAVGPAGVRMSAPAAAWDGLTGAGDPEDMLAVPGTGEAPQTHPLPPASTDSVPSDRLDARVLLDGAGRPVGIDFVPTGESRPRQVRESEGRSIWRLDFDPGVPPTAAPAVVLYQRGEPVRVPLRAFADLVAGNLPDRHPIWLVTAHGARYGLDLARAVADRTGVRVYSHTGRVDLAETVFGDLAVATIDGQDGLPDGHWVYVDPAEPEADGPESGADETGPENYVTSVTGERFHFRSLLMTPLAGSDGRLIGHVSMPDFQFRKFEAAFMALPQRTRFSVESAEGVRYGIDGWTPWSRSDGARHFLAFHGYPDVPHALLHTRDGRYVAFDGEQTAALLRRRASFEAFRRNAVGRADSAVIAAVCYAGRSQSIVPTSYVQQLANGLGLPVSGPTGELFVGPEDLITVPADGLAGWRTARPGDPDITFEGHEGLDAHPAAARTGADDDAARPGGVTSDQPVISLAAPERATRTETDAPAVASDLDRPNAPAPAGAAPVSAGVVEAAAAPVSAAVVEARAAPAVAPAVEDGTAAPDPTTSEAGAATGQERLSGSVTSFGTGRDGAQGLVHVDPVPEETVHWLWEQIFRHVEGDRGEVPAFRRAVRATLTPAYLSSEWARLFSEHGLPLRAPYRGGTYRVSLRFGLSEPRRVPAGIEEMPDGPPVGIQRWMFGVSESGSTDSTGDLRAASLSHGHTLPFAHTGWFRRLTFAPQLTFTHNQTTTSVTAGATVQPMVLLRSRERSWPVAYTLHAQLRTTASLGEAVTATPAADEWHTSAEAAPSPLTVWFPQHLLDDESDTAAPAGDDAERLPAPMEVLLGRVPLFATETVPHADRLLADVLRSFGPELDGLSEASLDQLRRFLDEGAVRGNLPLMYGGHHSSPTLYAENGSVIGMLRLHAEVSQRTGEQALAGPATRNGVLESHVLRSVRLSGTTAVTNAAGVGLAVSGGLALGSPDPAAGTAPAGLTLTAQAAVQQQVTDSVTAGGSARTSRSLRTAKPLLRVHADVVWRATLVRPDRPEQQPAEGSPLARGARYPLILRVPSAATVTGAPATPRHLPPELLHLRDLGVSTTPVAVRGTGPLFDELETWLGDHGFLPPRRGRAGAWYHGPVSGAAHLQRLNNQRKLDQLRSDMGLRAAFDEMTAGGHPVRFELPTATGTHRVSFRIAAERRYLTGREDGGVTHDLHLTGVQTLNYTGSTVVGDEQATRVPLALSGTVQASLTNPFDGHGSLWMPGLTPEYAHSRQSSRVTGSSSGTGHEFYALSPTADGVQVHTLPVTYRTSVSYSHGPAMEPREAEGEVSLAVPTYRTLERPAGSEPPAEVRPRPLGPDDAAVPANAVRLPETAWVDRAGGSRELRQAVNEMLAALRGALAEDTAADRSSRTDDVELRSMPGAWPEPVEDGRAADDRPADATAVPESAAGESRDTAAAPDTAAEASRDTAAEAPGRAGDAAAEPAERDHPAQADSVQADPAQADSAQAEPAQAPSPASDTATAWAAAAYRRWAANALDGAARAVRQTVGQAAAAVRRVDELATGQRPDAPGSVVQEVVEAGLSPHHLVANAYRLFNDRYVIEGASTSGVLTGTDITIEVEGRLTDVRAMPRPGVMDYERWIQSVDASAETRGTSRSHALGVTVAADYGASGRVVAPSGHYAHRRTVTEATTVNDTSAVFRVTSENDVPAHRFAATARYKVTVRAGLRNAVAGTVAAGPRYEDTRIVELPPESVEFLLSDHDLVNHPEFRLDGVPEPPEAAPADRALPSWFVGSGGRIGFGAVVEAHADGPDGGRSAFEDTVLRLVEQVAPGATVPGTAAYRPGVRSRINEHASSLGLRTLVNAGPDGHIGFSFVHPSWLGPMRVEVVLRARPAVPLDTVRGRRAAGNPGLDNVLGHTSGDGSSLPEPGSTRQTRSTTTSATADFSPVIQHGGYRFRPTLSASWQAGVADAATSTRDRRAWQRSMMDVSEFELRYRYEATVSARPMDELLPGASLRMLRGGLTGLADAVARRLPEDTRTALGHLAGRLPLPVRQVSDGVGVRVVLRFNGSETPAESAAPRPLVEPAVLTADPARPLAAPPEGTVIDMEVPAALRELLAAPAWVPRRPFAVYDMDALPQLAEALRAVDPSLGGPAGLPTSGSAEGMLVRLTRLAGTGRLTLLPPAATAPFLGQPGRGATSVQLSLYVPRSEGDSLDTAIDRVEIATDGALSQGDLTTTPALGFGLSAPLNGAATDRLGPTIPVTGLRTTAGLTHTQSVPRREMLRFGTPIAGAARGARGHRVRAVGVFRVTGPGGTRWVVGTVVLRTTEAPPAPGTGPETGVAGPAPGAGGAAPSPRTAGSPGEPSGPGLGPSGPAPQALSAAARSDRENPGETPAGQSGAEAGAVRTRLPRLWPRHSAVPATGTRSRNHTHAPSPVRRTSGARPEDPARLSSTARRAVPDLRDRRDPDDGPAVRLRPLYDADGRLIGYASHIDPHYEWRKRHYAGYRPYSSPVRHVPATPSELADAEVAPPGTDEAPPWQGVPEQSRAPLTFFDAHGNEGGIGLVSGTDEAALVPHETVGHLLNRVDPDGYGPIVLMSCRTGRDYSTTVARTIAEMTGRPVYAPTTAVGMYPSERGTVLLMAAHEETRRRGRWVLLLPPVPKGVDPSGMPDVRRLIGGGRSAFGPAAEHPGSAAGGSAGAGRGTTADEDGRRPRARAR
ncbi:hypothetical protein [Streptomyces sp. NRRL S-31]|uniref:hypothetical protein n=1 Tax=Streptomyces sp. NRRL S-31 TaxID=1463898 RepID=UPI00131E51CF|nr:hypothetical protein [Streptomyces sp. NRRL S-31]